MSAPAASEPLFIVVCMYCQKVLVPEHVTLEPGSYEASHGICEVCYIEHAPECCRARMAQGEDACCEE